MRIIVEVEVPDGEYCDVASCDFHGIYNSCELFGSNLEKIFIYGTSKCSACLAACQKAEEQKAEIAERWISVDERFPEPYVRKLVKLLTGLVVCASYSNLSERWLPDSGQSIDLKNVLAWRPLPEAPESEEK
jgi:hypothetical protein